MREEEETSWFTRWEEQLPAPDELMPLSSSLITRDLAAAFDIPTTHGGGNGDEPARTLKRPRLVWTPQLHKRFVDAVAHLGIKNAVPKTIMQLMSVDGLTRENVASHLQKYRLYLKRLHTGGAAAATPPPQVPPPYYSRFDAKPPQDAANRNGLRTFISYDKLGCD